MKKYILVLFFLISCRKGLPTIGIDGLDRAIDSLDNAVATFKKESDSWKSELGQFKIFLEKFEDDFILDLRETLDGEFKKIIDGGIQLASAEIKCDADYISELIIRDLEVMRYKLRETRCDYKPEPKKFSCDDKSNWYVKKVVSPKICSVTPTQVDASTINRSTTGELKISGYDFIDNDDNMKLSFHILDSNKKERAIDKYDVGKISEYQVSLNFSKNNGIKIKCGDKQIAIRFGNKERTINISAPICADKIPMFRMVSKVYNESTSILTNQGYCNSIFGNKQLQDAGYYKDKFLGSMYSPNASDRPKDTVPLYGLYKANTNTQDNKYTTNSEVYANKNNNNSEQLGIIGYVYTEKNHPGNTIPLYEAVRNTHGYRVYDIDKSAHDSRTKEEGWLNGGVCCYILQPPKQLPDNFCDYDPNTDPNLNTP